jgi:peptidyl-prolyl cis-trans isomerase D
MQLFLSKVSVTDQDIKNDYTANQTIYETPAKVSVSYIELSPQDIAKKTIVTEQEAQQYYQDHLSNYQIPQRWVVAQITIPVAANASSTVVAAAEKQANSVSNVFVNKLSTMVTLSAAEIDPPLHATLSAMKMGGVSKPLRTPNGYTVLKLIKVMPAETHSFASVKNNLMILLQHQQVNRALTKESSQLADLTYTNPESLDVAAKTLNLPIQTSPMMTKAGEKNTNGGIFANPKVVEAIFSDSVFKSNNNSAPIDLGNGSQIVLRINKKIPSEPIPLATVSAQIKTKLAQKQAEAQAGLLAYQLQKKIEAGANPSIIAKENKLKWNVVPLMKEAGHSSVSKEIIVDAFNTVGSKAVLVNQHDYAVIVINQVKNGDFKNMSTQAQQKISQQITTMWGQLMRHCFVSSVMASSKIKMMTK